MTKRHIVDVTMADLVRRRRAEEETALCGLLCPSGEYTGKDDALVDNEETAHIYCKTCVRVRAGKQRPGVARVIDARTHVLAKWQADNLAAHCVAQAAPEDQGDAPQTWGVKLEYRGKHIQYVASCLPSPEAAQMVIDGIHGVLDILYKIKE